MARDFQFTPFEYDSKSDGNISIKIKQKQSDPSVSFFEMPVPVRLIGQNKDTIVVLQNSQDGQVFNFNVGFKVNSLVFDPEKWLCAKVDIINEIPELQLNESVIYPNPASDQVNIFSENIINRISISGLDGKILTDIKTDDKNSFEFYVPQAIANGLYLVKVFTDKGILLNKLNIYR